LSLEANNKEKRKQIPLTIEEWLIFFFLPLKKYNPIFPSESFNEIEEERFIRHGFNKKLEQTRTAKNRVSYFIVC